MLLTGHLLLWEINVLTVSAPVSTSYKFSGVSSLWIINEIIVILLGSNSLK